MPCGGGSVLLSPNDLGTSSNRKCAYLSTLGATLAALNIGKQVVPPDVRRDQNFRVEVSNAPYDAGPRKVGFLLSRAFFRVFVMFLAPFIILV
jgi:hypothetical protein